MYTDIDARPGKSMTRVLYSWSNVFHHLRRFSFYRNKDTLLSIHILLLSITWSLIYKCNRGYIRREKVQTIIKNISWTNIVVVD